MSALTYKKIADRDRVPLNKNFLVWKGHRPELTANSACLCIMTYTHNFVLQKWSIYYDIANGKYYKIKTKENSKTHPGSWGPNLPNKLSFFWGGIFCFTYFSMKMAS